MTDANEGMEKPWSQEEMGTELVAEAIGQSPVRISPRDSLIAIYPVVPDEKRPVDLTVLKYGADLPDMGVIVAVGWLVNQEIVKHAEASPELADMMMRTQFYGVGDIVAVNRFSGMDLPGTNMILVDRQDLLTKMFNFPVRLRQQQERWDQVAQAVAADEAAASQGAVATPSKIVHAGR